MFASAFCLRRRLSERPDRVKKRDKICEIFVAEILAAVDRISIRDQRRQTACLFVLSVRVVENETHIAAELVSLAEKSCAGRFDFGGLLDA
jgi:hypothetical protein